MTKNLEISTQRSAKDLVPALENPNGILTQEATTTIDIANTLRLLNVEHEGDNEYIITDREHNKKPELKLNMIPQPKTETEIKRDPDEDNKAENRTENKDPTEEEFTRRVEKRVMETFKQDPPREKIQERLYIN